MSDSKFGAASSSFSKAAHELHLTASAVRQQIKQLEAHLGMPLFRRLTRAIELTEAGEAFARVATRTLGAYRDGHADLMGRFGRPVLRISMVPMVAHELVIPALSDFKQACPDIDLRLETSMALADFQHDAVDAALRIGDGNWPGLEVLRLADCHGTVVASPERPAAAGPLVGGARPRGGAFAAHAAEGQSLVPVSARGQAAHPADAGLPMDEAALRTGRRPDGARPRGRGNQAVAVGSLRRRVCDVMTMLSPHIPGGLS